MELLTSHPPFSQEAFATGEARRGVQHIKRVVASIDADDRLTFKPGAGIRNACCERGVLQKVPVLPLRRGKTGGQRRFARHPARAGKEVVEGTWREYTPQDSNLKPSVP